MASRLKKVKTILGKEENANMQIVMSQMMGGMDAEVEIIVPKFKEITDQAIKVSKILTTFATFTSLRRDFQELNTAFDEVLRFVDVVKKSLEPYTKYSEAKLYSMDQKQLNVIYKELKENKQIKLLITVAGEIKTWCPNIADEAKLDLTFVLRSVGAVCPFSFSTLELGHIWRKHGTTEAVKKYIMMVIHKVYLTIMNIYNAITSPDIDPEQMSMCVFDALSVLSKVPELKSCKKAFLEIQNHTMLFKSNFGSYYKDAIVSGNSNLILERFLMDVTASSKDKSVLSQLSKIVMYVRQKTTARGTMSKESASTFAMLDRNFALVEKEKENARKGTQSDPDEPVAIESAPDITGAAMPADTAVEDALDSFLESDEKEIAPEGHENPFWKPDFVVPELIQT